MSGGVIKRYRERTLAKIDVDGESRWYFCDLPAFEGDKVRVEADSEEKTGVVAEVKYNVSPLSSPVPFGSLKNVTGIIEE